jgi:NADH-quinone oxidoreductase subunit C
LIPPSLAREGEQGGSKKTELMNPEIKNIIEDLKKKFEPEILNVTEKNDKRITVDIPGKAILKISRYLYHDQHFRFIIASALQTKKGFEIYYHFSFDSAGLILNLHVILPEEKPEVESLTVLFEGANWIEREMHEILGINFLNHPNLEKLISQGNWAEGVYPYRKKP